MALDKQSPDLGELIDTKDSAWPVIQDLIRGSTLPIEVLPNLTSAGERALIEVQVTTRSFIGATCYHTSGILANKRLLRFLGAGHHPEFQRSLPSWNAQRSVGFYLVADDAIGGYFALNGGALSGALGEVFYFAPDSLVWEPLEIQYSDFFAWALTDAINQFYGPFLWDDWEAEVAVLTGDEILNFYPPLSTNGISINNRSRKVISVQEHYKFQLSLAESLRLRQ